MTRALCCLLLTYLTCSPLPTQIERLPVSVITSDSASATCYEESTGRVRGSQLVRSHVLVSRVGQRAFTKNQAIAFRRKGPKEDWDCDSTSRLFLSSGEGKGFRQLLVLWPTPDLRGNSLSIVDWSADGRWLLITEGRFHWGSDVGWNVVRVYDSRRDTLSDRELIPRLFSERVGHKCAGIFEPQGFLAEGDVVLEVSPFFLEAEEQPEKDSCVQKKERWLLNPSTHLLRAQPEDYKVQRYGRRIDATKPK